MLSLKVWNVSFRYFEFAKHDLYVRAGKFLASEDCIVLQNGCYVLTFRGGAKNPFFLELCFGETQDCAAIQVISEVPSDSISPFANISHVKGLYGSKTGKFALSFALNNVQVEYRGRIDTEEDRIIGKLRMGRDNVIETVYLHRIVTDKMGTHTGSFRTLPILSNRGYAKVTVDSLFSDEDEIFHVESQDNTCLLCCDHPINCICSPCGHLALCFTCGEKLKYRICPLCRETIMHLVIPE